MEYIYREELEELYTSEAEHVTEIRDVILSAMKRAEERCIDPWNEPVRFVVSPADGIADYIYDNKSKSRFRAPMFKILPVLIKYGDIVVLEGPGKLIKKSRVISELERMLEEAKGELESVEKKLKKRKSSYLEERKRFLESEIARIARALEYLRG
jgi:hypothetical protein